MGNEVKANPCPEAWVPEGYYVCSCGTYAHIAHMTISEDHNVWLCPRCAMLAALDEADTAFGVFNMCGDVPQTRAEVKKAWAMVAAAIARVTGRPDRFKEANPDYRREG